MYVMLTMTCLSTQEYKSIDLSWQQRYSQMTPLFAASLATQPGQTQTDGGASIEPGVLRATQKSVEFTPTQGRQELYYFSAVSIHV